MWWATRTGYLFGPDSRGSDRFLLILDWGEISIPNTPKVHTASPVIRSSLQFRLPKSLHLFYLFPKTFFFLSSWSTPQKYYLLSLLQGPPPG